MAPRPCLVCGTPSRRSRCPTHTARQDRPSAHARGLGRAHQRISAQVIEEWVAQHGWICPGWKVLAHPVAPGMLTGDHILPRATHPHLAAEPANLAVLCRACNSRKGAR